MRVVMIGDIYGNDTPLYYPDDNDFTIYETNWHQEVSLSAEFTFNVPKTNPRYADLEEYKVITLLNDGKEEWRGFIKQLRESSDRQSINVYCIEDLSWLNLEIAPVQQNVDRATKLQQVISAYNAMDGVAGTVKTFEAGYVVNGGTGLWQADYETKMLDALRGLAGEDQYVRVRRQYDEYDVLHRYIDFVTLPSYGKNSRQKIEFGENLRDFAKEISTSWMLNVINPYGAELEGQEVYDGCTRRLSIPSMSNPVSISKYGRIEKNILFEATDATTLTRLAEDYLEQNKDPRLTLELSAIDLSQAGYDTDSLNLGDKVKVIAEPYDIDQYVYITELNIDIQDLTRNFITLSSAITAGRRFTEQTASITKAITKKIPDATSILNTAKANAIAMLSGADGGCVNFIFDDDGQYIEEIWITDSVDPLAATKKWVWNINGWGYMYLDENEQWQTNIAGTMNGELVADMIKVGNLNADLLKVGIIADRGGNFSLNMATGALNMNSGTFRGLVAAATVQGCTIQGGSMNINNLFTVNSSGEMVAQRGRFGVLNIDASNSSIYASGIITLMDEYVYLETSGSGRQFRYDLIIDTAYFSDTTYLSLIFDMLSGADGRNIGTVRLYTYYKDGSTGSQIQSFTIYAQSGTYTFNSSFVPNSGLYLIRFALKYASSYRSMRITLQTTNQLKALLFSTGGITAASIRGQLSGRVMATDFSCGGWHFEGNNKRDFLFGEVDPYQDYIRLSVATGFSYRLTENSSINYYMRVSYDQIYRQEDSTYYYAQFYQGSDRRIKEDIEDINEKLSVEFINGSKPKSFRYINDTGTHYGMIAQEVRELLDLLGMNDAKIEHGIPAPPESDVIPEDMRTLEYVEYIPHLINYVKDLRAECNALRTEINEIKQILKERRN